MGEVLLRSVFDFNSIEEMHAFLQQCRNAGDEEIYFKNEDFLYDFSIDAKVKSIAYGVLLGDNGEGIAYRYLRWLSMQEPCVRERIVPDGWELVRKSKPV